MTRRLSFRTEASEEFLEATGWYEDQRPGLGRRFIDAVDRTLDAIADNPRLYQLVYRDVRRAVVDRFLYGAAGDRSATVALSMPASYGQTKTSTLDSWPRSSMTLKARLLLKPQKKAMKVCPPSWKVPPSTLQK